VNTIIGQDLKDLELAVARARIVLCPVVLLSVYVDPTTGGFLGVGGLMLGILTLHLIYGLATYLAINVGTLTYALLWVTAGLDLVFASSLAFLTEGPTSPALVLFMFAIVAIGCWADMRSILLVTLLSVVLYLVAIMVSGHGLTNPYLMRAMYLAIAAYLVDFIGQQRDRFEARVHELEAEAQRQKIARSLHDGYVQALAGFNLRLASCRDLLANNRASEALSEIAEVQNGVIRQYDEVRDYLHALAGAHERSIGPINARADTRFCVQASFTARAAMAEQVLQIALEGVRNTQKHGLAASSQINIGEAGAAIRITIDDDGSGFKESDALPWTITSRVAELGGWVARKTDQRIGAHLEMEIPKRR
jgi:signal transduction histidine kinase